MNERVDSAGSSDLYSVEYWKRWRTRCESGSSRNSKRSNTSSSSSRPPSATSVANYANATAEEQQDLILQIQKRMIEKQKAAKEAEQRIKPVLSTKRRTQTRAFGLPLTAKADLTPLETEEMIDQLVHQSDKNQSTTTVAYKKPPSTDYSSSSTTVFGRAARGGARDSASSRFTGFSTADTASLNHLSTVSDHSSSSMASFNQSDRWLAQNDTTTTPGPQYNPKLQRTSKTFVFPKAQKRKTFINSSPAPNAYELPSTFDSAAIKRYDPLAVDNSSPSCKKKVDIQVDFGYGCNVNEHIKYGKCLDGMCLKRGSWERSNPSSKQVSLKSKKKSTALHFACKSLQHALVTQICQAGAPLNLRDEAGQTPLHIACHKGDTRLVQILLSASKWTEQQEAAEGADPNLQDNGGRTPLHLAVKTFNERIVIMLLDAGASIFIADINSKTPLQCCGPNQKVYQTLRAHALSYDLQDKYHELELRQKFIHHEHNMHDIQAEMHAIHTQL